jgi:hypothetical protein
MESTSKMTAANAAKIIKSRTLVTSVGYSNLRVTSIVPHKEGFIANFSAMTPYHQSEALKLMKEGDFQEAVNQNISINLRASDYRPEKGEIVRVNIEDITTANGVKGLFPTSIAKLQSNTSGKISSKEFDAFLEEAPVETIKSLEDTLKV